MVKSKIGVFVCHCGTNIAGTVNIKTLVEGAQGRPGVTHVEDLKYACSEPGQAAIKKAIKEKELDRIVVAACSPRMHEPTFRRCAEEAGLNPYLVTLANIREHCSWVHIAEPERATQKALDLVKMAIAGAPYLEAEKELEFPVTSATLVVGGGVAGIQAALDLADAGFQVYLVEKSASLGGLMARLNKTYPTMDCSI